MNRPLVLLVGTGTRTYREYLLRAAAAEFDLWLCSDRDLGWEAPHLVGHTMLDTGDVDALTAAAKAVTPDGVLTWDDTRVVHAARLAEALGLPTSPPSAVLACRDKHLTRRTLHAAGVPQARSVLVGSLREARAAAAEIGFPLVLKPRALNASMGVVAVESPEQLASRYRIARGASLATVTEAAAGDVLVEEYLDGDEISIDAAWHEGRPSGVFVARKQLGFAPCFEETGHVVDAGDPLLADRDLLDLLTNAHEAVGVHTGWTHTEVRLTGHGPKIVEINARLGGDRIPEVARLATGIDAACVAAEVACGHPPRTAPRTAPPRTAAVRFLYPPGDVLAKAVRIDHDRLPTAVHSAEVIAMPGQELRLPPRGHVSGRYALLTAVADTAAECAAALDEGTAAVHLDVLRELH